MPLSFYFQPSLKRSLKVLGSEQKKVTGMILESLQVYYSTACNLEEAQRIAPGFFYKQLKRPYYEAGIEKNLRVIIRHDREDRIALLAGNHDQIKQFLTSSR
jgi:hypothetical protein